MKKISKLFLCTLIFILLISFISLAAYHSSTEVTSNTFTIKELNQNLRIAWCDYPYDDEGGDVGEEPDDPLDLRTITFNLQGIMSIDDNVNKRYEFYDVDGNLFTVEDGQAIEGLEVDIPVGTCLADHDCILPVLKYNGKIYDKWTIAGEDFTIDTVVTENMTLYPVMSTQTAKVDFKLLDPTSEVESFIDVISYDVEVGKTLSAAGIDIPAANEIDGYTFKQWDIYI